MLATSCVLIMALAMQSDARQTDANSSQFELKWDNLPSIPDSQGFAGMYAGVSNDVLVVAGGANFPRGFPWEGGTKAFYDSIFVLDRFDGMWRSATEKLPRQLAYGVSVTWNNSVICVGGSDLKKHYSDVFTLTWKEGKIAVESLPSLPEPCANMCGCLVDSTIFIAGGTSTPDATTAMKNFWSLDLSKPPQSRQWNIREPWPGLDRSHAVAAVLGGNFYLISGFRWKPDEQGKPSRISPFQTDFYRFSPKTGPNGEWKRLADLPRALGAAPTPALGREPGFIDIIGGIDDTVVFPDPAKHPGFRRDIHRYDVRKDQWSLLTQMPEGTSRVTLPSAIWKDRYIIVNGERAPGRRSPEVYSVRIR